MKAADVVRALFQRLPALTDQFTTITSIDSITSAGTTATATVSAGHGLVDTELVTITGAVAPLTISSITRVDNLATVITATDHDFTLSDRETASGFIQNAIISGATEAEFNGTFGVNEVLNRREFTIDIDDSGPLTATGSPVLQNGNSGLYNGAYNISLVSSTVFTYTISEALPLPATGSPALNLGHHITSAVSLARFVDAYTKQSIDDLWLCVVLGDVTPSKNRNVNGDSTDINGDNIYYTQELIQQFSINLVVPAKDSLTGASKRDDIEDLIPLIFQSVLLESFDSGFTSGAQKKATFVSHGFVEYDGATYIHEIVFEQVADINEADTIGEGDHVAFRDIELNFLTNLGTGTLQDNINLDQEPIVP